jgi:hypothetical protein
MLSATQQAKMPSKPQYSLSFLVIAKPLKEPAGIVSLLPFEKITNMRTKTESELI